MRPIPIAFHLGPLEIHTYGVGLALTFWFGYRYFAYRLRRDGFDDTWLSVTFVQIVVAAIIGARIVHVIANLSIYQSDPTQVFAVWNGGLSSFGGLAAAIPVGFLSAHRRCPGLRAGVAADLVAPVLAAAWAMGRLLGPQLMNAGGGKRTSDWFGMYYAGQPGKRLPVPIFQALECGVVFVIALLVERVIRQRHGPIGVICATVVSLWSLSRFFDEYLWLGPDNGTDAVEVAALILTGLGLIAVAILLIRARNRPQQRADDTAVQVT